MPCRSLCSMKTFATPLQFGNRVVHLIHIVVFHKKLAVNVPNMVHRNLTVVEKLSHKQDPQSRCRHKFVVKSVICLTIVRTFNPWSIPSSVIVFIFHLSSFVINTLK